MALKDNLVEALIGLIVLVVGGWFFIYAYNHTQMGAGGGYELKAKFDSATGVSVGSDVRISGIKVGSVTSLDVDASDPYFRAQMTLSVADKIKLPADSEARISSEGLLGGSFVNLVPGGADELLKPGDEIENTKSAADLMSLIGRAIYSVGGGKDEKEAGAPAAEPAADPMDQ